MAKFRFNTDELQNRIRQQIQENREKAERAMANVGHYLRGEIQLRTPIDEGHLTGDIQFEVIPLTRSVSVAMYVPSNAASSDYAIKMHEGFYRLGTKSLEKQAKVNVTVGRRFITRGIDENFDDIENIIASEMSV